MASGLVVLIPLVVTVAVIRFLFAVTSGILPPVIDPAVGDWPPMLRALLSTGYAVEEGIKMIMSLGVLIPGSGATVGGRKA